jgi:hypothetical protein
MSPFDDYYICGKVIKIWSHATNFFISLNGEFNFFQNLRFHLACLFCQQANAAFLRDLLTFQCFHIRFVLYRQLLIEPHLIY